MTAFWCKFEQSLENAFYMNVDFVVVLYLAEKIRSMFEGVSLLLQKITMIIL